MHCPGGNATEPIWRVMASSDGISSWTPLKPLHSNPNPNPLPNQILCIYFLNPPTLLAIPHRLPAFRPDCIFEIYQLWQSGFSRVYSNCCCSCSFKPEIIKIGQISHKMYSNNIVNVQESMTILNACTKKSGNLLNVPRNRSSDNIIMHFISSFGFNTGLYTRSVLLWALLYHKTVEHRTF